MSKIKFGNFITYTGKYLSTAMSKAQSGNLVFARIINSPVEGADKAEVTLTNIIVDGVLKDSYVVNNVGKDGYYIFGGKADGHLVTFDTFKALKDEVADLNTKVGNLSIDGKEYVDVPAYVAAYVSNRLETLKDYKVKDVKVGDTSIADENGVVTLGDAAQKNVATAIAKDSTDLATAGQVFDAIDAITEVVVAQGTGIAVGSTTVDGTTTYTVSVDETIATTSYVDEKISTLGDVVNFLGVVDEKPTSSVVIVNGVEIKAQNGDLVFTKTGEEYIWTGEWEEIGKVDVDEAVTSLGNVKGDITLGDGLSMVGQQLTVTFPDAQTTSVKGSEAIGVTGVVTGNNTEYEVSLKIGSTGNVTLTQSEDGLVANVDAKDLAYTNDKSENNITNVSAALDELYDDSEVVSAALVDLKSEIDDLDTRLGTIEADYVKSVSTTSSPYISIDPNKGDVKVELSVATTNQDILDQADDALVSAAGLKEYSKAENIAYAGTTGSTATNVEGALDDLYSQIATVDGAAVKSVTGDTYVGATTVDGAVTLTTNIADVVSTSDIDGYDAATASGLATDAYVKDYVAYMLAWEDITD